MSKDKCAKDKPYLTYLKHETLVIPLFRYIHIKKKCTCEFLNILGESKVVEINFDKYKTEKVFVSKKYYIFGKVSRKYYILGYHIFLKIINFYGLISPHHPHDVWRKSTLCNLWNLIIWYSQCFRLCQGFISLIIIKITTSLFNVCFFYQNHVEFY